MAKNLKTFILGIDGADWAVIDRLIETEALPNLERLKKRGFSGELESITPPMSPPAWTSIQTGVNPGKHGIYDFSKYTEDYRRRSINSTDRLATPFWEILNDNDVSTGIFKLPFTYPPREVDGFIVTGFPTPNKVKDYAKPEAVSKKIGDPQKLFEKQKYQKEGDYEAYMENLIRVAEYQTEVFMELIEEYETDFLMNVYDGSDRIQHFFWKYFDEDHPEYMSDEKLSKAIPEYYRKVDEGVGKILEKLGEEKTNTLVISDHGFGPLVYDMYMDEWLERNGYLSWKESSNQISRRSGQIVGFVWDVVKKLGLRKPVKKYLPHSVISGGSKLVHSQKSFSINWDETQAFFTTVSGKSIFINIEGKFEFGIISSSEYDELVEEIKTDLSGFQNPETSEVIIEKVYHKNEIFDGWAVDSAPDLVIKTNPKYALKDGESDKLITPSKQNDNERSGDHRKSGIFIASGPDFVEGDGESFSIMDVAPTILYMLGCPVPESMDGEPVKDLFREDIRENKKIKYTSEYGRLKREKREWSESEEEELEDRLEDLGYM